MIKNICLIACLLLTASFSFSSPSSSRSIGGQVDKAQQSKPTKPEIFSTRSAPVECTIRPSEPAENPSLTPVVKSRSGQKERLSERVKSRSIRNRAKSDSGDQELNELAVLGFAFGAAGLALSILGVIAAVTGLTAAVLFIPLSLLFGISAMILCGMAFKSEKRKLSLIGFFLGLATLFLPIIFWSVVLMGAL
jgi:hypothetical protein